MDNFKKAIRTRILLMSLVAICTAAGYFVLLATQNGLRNIPDFIRGFHAGAFSGLELVLVFFIAKYLSALKNENSLKKLYIEEHDERAIMIMQKTGAMGMTICSIGLALGTVIAGFFNQIAFFSLLGATVFSALIRGFFKLYYHLKY